MKTGLLATFETLMTAVTFAEKNDSEYAIRLMESLKPKSSQAQKTKGKRPESRPRMTA